MKASEKIEHLEQSLREMHEKLGAARTRIDELSNQRTRLQNELNATTNRIDNQISLEATNRALLSENAWLRSIVERAMGARAE